MANQLSLRERLKIYWRITELGSLTRRYIVIGAFDGALTIVAIVLAALAAAVFVGALLTHDQVNLLIRASLSAGVGLAISSAWGAYEAERVERKREIQHLEQHMHRPMDGCMVESAVKFATGWASFIHGVSPLPAAILPLIPLVVFTTDFVTAAIISVIITMIFLFILGIWMGRIAKTNMLLGGLRIVLIGLITGVICVLIGAY